MKKFIVLLALVVSVNCAALERRDLASITINDLILDTQAQSESADDSHHTIVWWVIHEFWASAFAREPNISETAKTQMLDALDDYTILGIVQGDIASSGVLNFYSRSEVLSTLALSYEDASGTSEKLIPISNLSEQVETLLDEVTPMLKAAMGHLGANIHFFVYSNKNDSGVRRIDPYREGLLKVYLENRGDENLDMEFSMPLNSLYKPRICPNGKPADVSWKYCPWSGEKI